MRRSGTCSREREKGGTEVPSFVIQSAAEQLGRHLATHPDEMEGCTTRQVADDFGISTRLVTDCLRNAGERLAATGRAVYLDPAAGHVIRVTSDRRELWSGQVRQWKSVRTWEGRLVRELVAVDPALQQAGDDLVIAIENFVAAAEA